MDIDTLKRAIRIIEIARKPENEEVIKIAKITGAGIIVMGLTGLVIAFAFSYI